MSQATNNSSFSNKLSEKSSTKSSLETSSSARSSLTTPTLAWWKSAVAYQIYPRSFYDSNGDGIGDINGIIEKLDYLAELGIDLVWICPFYQSPNDDNGYDISDYQAIHPDFGTLADVDHLISQAHQRGIRIILDLVINHTSDEHPWFIESRQSKDNPKRDWYIWRDGTPENTQKPTTEPNNWESIFHGSAWEYDQASAQYYLHLFSKKQPDLNWENPEVKQALFKMIHWWLERGIDGFRVDAISHIKKEPNLPDLPNPKGLQHVSSFDYHMNVKGIETHLTVLKTEAFDPFDIVTVGEANGVSPEEALFWVEEKSEHAGKDDKNHQIASNSGKNGGIFNMIFQFEHMSLWAEQDSSREFDLVEFKGILTRWQDALEGKGWNALYLENHDQPRSINTFADENYWYHSATSLATCYFLMKGTPFIYQGQEIGMTNHPFQSIDEFQDVSARNLAKKLANQGLSPADILDLLNRVSRDHSRTPMQWDNSTYAGFSSHAPWLGVNPNKDTINVATQSQLNASKGEYSVLDFYKQLIQLRKNHLSLITGRYQLLLAEDAQIYAYQRISDSETWTIITNLSAEPAVCDLDAHDLNTKALGICLLSNQSQDASTISLPNKLAPYSAYVFLTSHS